MKKHVQLLIALVLGMLAGVLLHPYSDVVWLNQVNTNFLQPVGQIFLRLIFMIVVPMIFSAMVIGVFELGKGRGLGRVAGRTMFFTLIASTFSVFIGILLVNAFQPGRGLTLDSNLISQQSASVTKLQQNADAAKPLTQILVELIPKNPLDAAVRAFDGEMIAFMFFALIFGFALSLSAGREKKENVLISVLEQIFAVCMKVVDFAMVLAPYAVFCLVFNTTFKFGHGVFKSVLAYVLVVVFGLLIQQFVVYSAMLKTMSKISPFEFFKKCREVYLYAFSTASSNATLPLALDTAEHKLGLRPDVSRFVLTVGSTANQNGTALFEGVTVLFLAQVYNIDLTLAQQIQVVLMSILAGIGTAGVPGGSLPLIMILLQSVGIPAEGMGLVLGVDRFLDMCRTTVNVSGDLVIAALVNSGKKEKLVV
ncbi:MAG: dicarboxylate/amino acid:cation symporter [Oligoflexia bacterium]|nr:dicarboxylate/amino acid:cation symporter [Oligoflexia bacterium]